MTVRHCLLLLSLALPLSAEAGIFDRLKGCAENAARSVKKATDKISERTSEIVAEVTENVTAAAKVLTAQLKEAGENAKEYSTSFAAGIARESLGLPIRFFRFESSIEGLKFGIVVPLAGHLGNFRSESGAKRVEHFGRLLVFFFEAQAKLTMMFTTQISFAPIAGAGLAIGVKPGGPEGIPTLLLGFFRERLGRVFLERDLSLSERFDLLIASDEAVEHLLKKISEETGWTDLDAEIKAWRNQAPEEDAGVVERP